jgi:UDP-glucose 4-epimerase
MKCLIIGGAGFIGSHLTDGLLDAGHEVRVFDRPSLAIAGTYSKRTGVEWCEGDFLNEEDLARVLAGCEIVIHLAWTTLPKSSNENPVYDVETNLIGTLRLMELARESGVRRLIFCSSGGTVYGIPKQVPLEETHSTDPMVSYGITKLAVEKYLKVYKNLHGLDFKILRVANPFGERQRINTAQGAISVFLFKALREEPIEIWGDGSVVRDYIYIKDVIDAFLLAINYEGDADVFNIGSGIGRSLNQIITAIEESIGRSVNRRYLPPRGFDVPANVLDISRARSMLGWEPKTPFQQAIDNTLQWLKSL